MRTLPPCGLTRCAVALLLVALAHSPRPAHANDTVAQLGNGGLEFTSTDAITLENEDLFVSRERIRVAYRFRNRTHAPVDLRVAFPLPRLDMRVVFGCSDVSIPFRDRPNFVAFETRVGGRTIPLERQERAFVGEREVTGLLREAGLPFASTGDDLMPAIARLKSDVRERLRRGGALIEESCEDGADGPAWTTEVIYHRQQRFEANAITMVEHSYVPSVGAFFIVQNGKLVGSPDARYPSDDPSLARYCIDDATWEAIRRLGQGREVAGRPLEYILRTARSWHGPIGAFTLTIDKGASRGLVSLCASGVRRTGPNTFEVRKQNYRPDDDLAVLFIDPPVQ